MNPGPAQRTIDDGPWCWSSKAARRLIRHYFEPAKCIGSALGVYEGLCEIASDEQSENFEASIDKIARTSGVARRTASTILEQLHLFKFIQIEKRKFPGTNMDAPSIYIMLVCPDQATPVGNGCTPVGNGCTPVGNGCTPVGNGCTPVGNGAIRAPLHTSEESLKNGSEESAEQFLGTASTNPPSFVPQPQAVGAMKKSAKASAKKTGAETVTDPRHALVTAGYCDAYQEVFGQKYVHAGGKDGKRLQQFLTIDEDGTVSETGRALLGGGRAPKPAVLQTTPDTEGARAAGAEGEAKQRDSLNQQAAVLNEFPAVGRPGSPENRAFIAALRASGGNQRNALQVARVVFGRN